MHQVTILMTDRGTPRNHRTMDGFSSHTYSFINAAGVRTWVKLHWKSLQGCAEFTDAEAAEMRGRDPDHAQRDLLEAIERKEYPRWTLLAQFMTDEQARAFRWNPFDLTKIWPHAEFPEHEVGVMELNENPANYFASIEQAAFAPSNIVDGVGFSPDRMLQARIFAYQDAHRYRLGANSHLLPVNACPFSSGRAGGCPWSRDGPMRVDDNGGRTPNYFPNSFTPDIALGGANGRTADGLPVPPVMLDSTVGMYWDRNAGPGEDDHYSQAGNLVRRVLGATARGNLAANVAGHMGGVSGPMKDVIIERALRHWFAVDTQLGLDIARRMNLAALGERLASEVPQAQEPVATTA
jgi:catalase